MAFGDVFAGWMGEATKHYQNLLQMDYQNKRDIATQYSKIAEDPRYDEETQAEAQKRSLEMLTFQPMQKPPKEYTNFTFTRKPPVSAPVQMPGAQGQGSPIPSQLPAETAGPVPELGQVGQETSLQSLQPGGATSPTAGATPQTQTLQPPTPPPYTAQMAPMPFAQQTERLRERTTASTKYMPSKIDDVKSMDPDTGEVYSYAHYQGINPQTGQYGDWYVKNNYPVTYAPRAVPAGALNVADAQKLSAAGINNQVKAWTPDEITKINQVLPGSRIIPTGYGGAGYIASQTYRPESIGNQIYEAPTVPPTGQPLGGAQPVGVSRPPVETTRNQPLPGIRTASGDVATGTTTSLRTPQTPGASGVVPPPSPMPTSQAAPVAAPGPVAAPAPMPTSPAPAMPPVPRGTSQAAPPVAPTAAPRSIPGIPAQTYASYERAAGGLNEIAKTVANDPAHPVRDTLDSPEFVKLVANPQVRQKMATLFNRLSQLPKNEGTAGADAGLSIPGLAHLNGIGEWLSNLTGFTQETARAAAASIQEAMADLAKTDPAAIRFLNTIQSMYSSMPGLRSITQNGAYQSAMRNLERDIPTMLNTVSLSDFYNKLGNIQRDIANATEIPDLRKVMGGNSQWAGLADQWNRTTDHYFATAKLTEKDPEGFTTMTVGPDGHWYYRPGGNPQAPLVPLLPPAAPTPPPGKK